MPKHGNAHRDAARRLRPNKYLTQMFWQMECTGRDWCDFVSYDPRLPEHMRLFVQRVPRDDERIRHCESKSRHFKPNYRRSWTHFASGIRRQCRRRHNERLRPHQATSGNMLQTPTLSLSPGSCIARRSSCSLCVGGSPTPTRQRKPPAADAEEASGKKAEARAT